MFEKEKIFEFFPIEPKLLAKYESSNESTINSSLNLFGYFNKVLDSFLYLFTDDINNTLSNLNLEKEGIVLLYSEIIKRFRSSYILAKKGYVFGSLSLLRSVYELNIGINAIHNGVLSFIDYLGSKHPDEFNSLSDEEKFEAINKLRIKKDKKIKKFHYANIPDNLKFPIKNFESNLHLSVHKSFSSLIINVYEIFFEKTQRRLFYPDIDKKYYGAFLNYASFMVLITLKNLMKENFINNNNINKIKYLIHNIEYAFETSDDKFHNDMISYAKLKF